MKNKPAAVPDPLVVVLHSGKCWGCPGTRLAQWMRVWKKKKITEMREDNMQIGEKKLQKRKGTERKRNVLLVLF